MLHVSTPRTIGINNNTKKLSVSEASSSGNAMPQISREGHYYNFLNDPVMKATSIGTRITTAMMRLLNAEDHLKNATLAKRPANVTIFSVGFQSSTP